MPAMPISEPAVFDGLVLVLVENDDRVGRQRTADRHLLVRVELRQRRRDRRLGRSIGVQDGAAGTMPADHEVVRTGLAGHEQDAQVRQVLLDRRQQGGDAGEVRDAPLQQKIRQVAADQAGSRLSGHQRRTGEQRNPKLLDREVEGNRHALIGAVAFADSVHLGRHLHEIADAGMLDRDALRGAGRARGVDDVGELVGGRRLLAGEADRLFCIDFRLGGIEENLPDG